MEQTLGAQLFDRDRRRVKLTAAGEALLASARGLLGGSEAAVSAVTEAAAVDARLLRVGTLTSIGRSLYPGVMDRFAARQPGWRGATTCARSAGATRPLALVTGSPIFAFLWLPVDADGLAHEVLVSERRFVAMSARHRLSRRRPPSA